MVLSVLLFLSRKKHSGFVMNNTVGWNNASRGEMPFVQLMSEHSKFVQPIIDPKGRVDRPKKRDRIVLFVSATGTLWRGRRAKKGGGLFISPGSLHDAS